MVSLFCGPARQARPRCLRGRRAVDSWPPIPALAIYTPTAGAHTMVRIFQQSRERCCMCEHQGGTFAAPLTPNHRPSLCFLSGCNGTLNSRPPILFLKKEAFYRRIRLALGHTQQMQARLNPCEIHLCRCRMLAPRHWLAALERWAVATGARHNFCVSAWFAGGCRLACVGGTKNSTVPA